MSFKILTTLMIIMIIVVAFKPNPYTFFIYFIVILTYMIMGVRKQKSKKIILVYTVLFVAMLFYLVLLFMKYY